MMPSPKALPEGIDVAVAPDYLLDDLPTTVRLLAGATRRLFGPAADIDGLVEFTAILAVRGAAFAGRCDRAGIAALRVLPMDLLADRGAVGAVGRVRGIGLVGPVKRLAHLVAKQRAEQHAARRRRQLPRALAELRAGQTARSGAAERPDALFGPDTLGTSNRHQQRCGQ